jgi:hypothetical protein
LDFSVATRRVFPQEAETPLFAAVRAGELPTIDFLLSRGCNIMHRNKVFCLVTV